jgi:Dcp1-like decapping family
MPRVSNHTRRQASVDHPRHPPQSLQAQTLQHPHQAPQVSEYESDNPAYVPDLPLSRPPETRTNDELNLTVLQRHNHEVSSILSIAPYAVIYEFNAQPEPTWNKAGIEGSLFICQLTPGPQLQEDRYNVIVLNRRGLENFEAEVREADNTGVEITDDYVIVSIMEEGIQKIFGIFIFSEGPGSSTEKTRTLNAELMKQCAVQAGLSLKAAEAAATEALPAHNSGHAHAEQPSVEEAALGVPTGRQTSLQELFGRQRVEDASFSVRVHSPEGRGQVDGMTQQPFNRSRQAQSGPRSAAPAQQQDVLGDLFRRAGLGYQP